MGAMTVKELRDTLTKVTDDFKVYIDTGKGEKPIPLQGRDIETLSILRDGKLEKGVVFLCTGDDNDEN